MATITTRHRADGTARYVARVRHRRGGRSAVSEARSFETEDDATAWAGDREAELAKLEAAGGDVRRSRDLNPTVAEAIERYLSMKHEVSDSKRCILERVAKFRLGRLRFAEVDAEHIIDFAQAIRNTKVKPATVTRYLAEVSAVFRFARLYWKAPLDPGAMTDAWTMAANLGICGKSHRRDRRPTLSELNRLMQHFHDRSRNRPTAIPMDRLVAFAIFSTRRRGEITRMRWDDLDADAKQILIRDMKNPGDRVGNNVRCDLPDPALAIVDTMPRRNARIWPYDPKSVSAVWSAATRKLNIKNLHFHDLRHEGISRLFEMGYDVPQVQAVSGHKNWTSVQRYTHLKEKGDRYDGWPWIDAVTERDREGGRKNA